MKTFLKILKWLGIILGVLIVILVVAVYSLFPPKFDSPKVEIAASTDSSTIAHGKYLVYGPAHCAECHTKVDRKNIADLEEAFQTKPLSGGLEFTMPGAVVYSGNLTPDKETGIGRYNDSELARLIKYCTRPDNTLLFPFMAYSGMTEQDVTAIVSYLRTLEPVNSNNPPNELNFMMKAFVAFLFNKPFLLETNAPKSIVRDTTADYGKYLANKISGCEYCHTNADMMTGEFIGKPYAGGQQTPPVTEEQDVWVYSPNLTPDPETGRIFDWTEEMFIQRFRQGRMVKESIMPWECFKSYTDNDLKAVYKYLQTLEPVNNEVKEVVVRDKK